MLIMMGITYRIWLIYKTIYDNLLLLNSSLLFMVSLSLSDISDHILIIMSFVTLMCLWCNQIDITENDFVT